MVLILNDFVQLFLFLVHFLKHSSKTMEKTEILFNLLDNISDSHFMEVYQYLEQNKELQIAFKSLYDSPYEDFIKNRKNKHELYVKLANLFGMRSIYLGLGCNFEYFENKGKFVAYPEEEFVNYINGKTLNEILMNDDVEELMNYIKENNIKPKEDTFLTDAYNNKYVVHEAIMNLQTFIIFCGASNCLNYYIKEYNFNGLYEFDSKFIVMSGNQIMVHIIENDIDYNSFLNESLKFHNNEFVKFICENQKITELNEENIEYSLKYFNFSGLSILINHFKPIPVDYISTRGLECYKEAYDMILSNGGIIKHGFAEIWMLVSFENFRKSFENLIGWSSQETFNKIEFEFIFLDFHHMFEKIIKEIQTEGNQTKLNDLIEKWKFITNYCSKESIGFCGLSHYVILNESDPSIMIQFKTLSIPLFKDISKEKNIIENIKIKNETREQIAEYIRVLIWNNYKPTKKETKKISSLL